MRRLLISILAASALLVGGCADAGRPGAPAASPSGAAYPVTVGTLTLDRRPERIVSLSPSVTEMLFAIGAGPQVTAVDDNSNYPPGVPSGKLSGFKPNAEAIAAANPDLVVLSNDLNNVVAQLTALKIPTFLTPSAATLDDTYRQLTDLGTLTGHAGEAGALVARMRGEIATLIASVPRRSTPLSYYYELDESYYTVTSKTFIGSLFAQLGMRNIADPADADGSKGGYPQLSEEALIKANPDMIFLADTKCCKQSPETVRARVGWSGIAAVKNNRIVPLDDDIASRWGPRVVDLVRAIVDAVGKVPS